MAGICDIISTLSKGFSNLSFPLNGPKRLSILSYNIDFQSRSINSRFTQILELIRNINSDVVALQEVPTSHLVDLRSKLSDIYPHNITSYRRKNTRRTYTELMLSKTPFTGTGYHKFEETLMDRDLIWGSIDNNGVLVTIATTHLESLDHNSKIRTIQANLVHKMLGSRSNVVLVGDLNTENSLGDISEFWTELPHNNPTWFLQRLHPSEPNISRRFDRAFVSNKWNLPPAEIISQVSSSYLPEEEVWTSDHDGLLIKV